MLLKRTPLRLGGVAAAESLPPQPVANNEVPAKGSIGAPERILSRRRREKSVNVVIKNSRKETVRFEVWRAFVKT
jgi:hypothetical protein